jgi:hypothetical protein
MTTIVLRLALLAGALAVGGCGSVRLHDTSADIVATAVKTSYTEVKIIDAIREEQADLDMLDKKEQEALLKIIAGQRDLELLALVNDGKQPFAPRLTTMIDGRIKDLVREVTDDKELAAIKDAVGRLQAAQRSYIDFVKRDVEQRGQLKELEPQFSKLPECTPANKAVLEITTLDGLRKALKSPEADVPESALRNYELYVTDTCLPAIAALAAVGDQQAKLAGGLLTKAIADAIAAEKKQAESRAEAELAKKALASSVAKVKSAQQARDAVVDARDLQCKEEPKEGAEPAKPAPPAGVQKICSAIAKLDSLGDVGKKIVEEEKIKQINVVLAALSGSADSKEKVDKLSPPLALLNTSQRFAFALEDYDNAKTLPALEPLLIEKQLAQSRLAYATRATELGKTRVSLTREKADALQLELDLLLQSRYALGGFNAAAKKSGLATLMSKESKSTSGRIAYRAMSLYAESYTVAQTRHETADLKLIVLGYRDSLNRSEASIAYWDGLIATPLAQLQAYHASGVKTGDIAALLQAISVFWIAVK